MPFVYIIKSEKEKWFYVGSAVNLMNRIKQHNNGEVKSTAFRRPYILVYKERFDSIDEARRREQRIKKQRKLKEEILKSIMASSSNG